MKCVKGFIVCLLAVMMAYSLCGCGLGAKISEKAGEKAAEQIIENYTSADVEISGDKVTVQDDQGNSYSYGGGEWPTSQLASCIPQFPGGTISGVMDSEESVFISLESVTQEDYEAYVSTVKESYTENSYEASSEGYYTYGATNKDGVTLTLVYSEATLTITACKEAQ